MRSRKVDMLLDWLRRPGTASIQVEHGEWPHERGADVSSRRPSSRLLPGLSGFPAIGHLEHLIIFDKIL